jgi:hypothetical protein
MPVERGGVGTSMYVNMKANDRYMLIIITSINGFVKTFAKTMPQDIKEH